MLQVGHMRPHLFKCRVLIAPWDKHATLVWKERNGSGLSPHLVAPSSATLSTAPSHAASASSELSSWTSKNTQCSGGGGVYMESFQKIFLHRVKDHLLHEERVSSLEVSFLFPSIFFWLNLPWDLIEPMEQHGLNDSRECKHYLVFLLDWRDWRLDSGHTLVPLGDPWILRHPEILLHPFNSRTHHLLQ